MSNDSNRTEMIRKAIAMLHEGGHTLVVANGNVFRTFDRRGVADLYRLLREEPEFLRVSDTQQIRCFYPEKEARHANG